MSNKILKATHEGLLPVGGIEIPCFVLPDGTRVITQRGIQTTTGMGTSGGKDGAQRLAQTVEKLEAKLSVSNDLSARIRTPIIFTPVHGGRTAYGNEATTLIDYCEMLLKARDIKGVLTEAQERWAVAADIVIRAFAKVGIIAVIDEVTGYQEIRDRGELERILDHYLRKEYATWSKRFPDEFYKQIFRLRGWQWRGMKVNRPSVVAHYTTDFVWARLAPGVLEELERLNPIEGGRRKVKHHQYLTDDVGHPALQAHLNGVTAIMRGSTTWEQACRMVQRAFPKVNTTLDIPFPDEAQT